MSVKKHGLPQDGRSREEVLAQMRQMRSDDLRWQDGKLFSLVFSAGEDAKRV